MAMELDANGTPPANGVHADHDQTLVAEANPTPPANPAAGATTITITLEAGDIVHLPAGTDVSHPVQVGADLEFIQPDGSIILIPGGAVADLVLFVGDVEIPADTIAALFTANNIQPAEGNGETAQGAHGNFTHAPGSIGSSFGLTDLLGPTALEFGSNNDRPRFPINFPPRFVGDHGQDISAVTLTDVSEEGLSGGIKDTSPDAARDTTDDKSSSGTFGVVDPNGDPLTFAIGQPVEALTSHGQTLVWTGVGTSLLIGSLPGPGGAEIIRIQIIDGAVNDNKGQYSVTLSGPIDHPDPNVEDVKTIHFNVTVSDGNGGHDSAVFALGIEDDGPTVTVTPSGEGTPSGLTMELDETVGADRYNSAGGETGAGDTNPNNDDGAGYLGRVTTTIGNGGLASLFTVGGDFGADGPGTLSGALSFSGIAAGSPLATNLSATHGGPISLVYVSDTEIDGRDASGTGDVVFKIEIVGGQLQTTLLEAIQHVDPNLFDANVALKLAGEESPIQLTYTVTRTDGDSDHATDHGSINLITTGGSVISFDDDGPKLVVTGVGGYSNGLFFDGFSGNPGWGPGSGIDNTNTAGAWLIEPSTVEPAGTIQLERVGDGYRGADSPSNSVMVDLEASPGNVQVSQTLTGLIIGEHYEITFEIGAAAPDATVYADSAILQVLWNGLEVGLYHPASGIMQVESLDIVPTQADNVLTFREIGDAGDNTGTYLANVRVTDVIIIDETPGHQSGDDEVADLSAIFGGVGTPGNDPDMPVQYAQGSHAILTATPDYGSDGPAAVNPLVFSFTLPSPGASSGLTTTEGDAIVLSVESGGIIVGRAVGGIHAGEAAFALAIDPTSGVVSVAQYLSLNHPDHGSSDEGIYLGANTVAVTVTATDGDGDHTSQVTDVSGLVRFEDDGPTVSFDRPSGEVLAGLTTELDETLGADRYNLVIGEVEDAGGNANSDDGTGLGRVTTTVVGVGGLLSLFPATIVYGADGPGTTVGTLSFSGIVPDTGIATNLLATHGGAIALYLEGNDLVGRDTDSDAVFRIAIVQNPPGTYQLQTTLYEALNHGLDGNLYDHEIGLLLQSGSIGLKYDVTVTDGDGDTASNSAVLPLIGTQSSYFSFDDDGPQLTAATHIGVDLIVNGSFEEGHGLGSNAWDTFYSVPGWSVPDTGAPGLDDDAPFEIQTGTPGGDFGAESGDAKVELDSDLVGTGTDDNPSNKTNATVQQTVVGTSAGEAYELSFWYAPRPNDGNPDSSSFKVYWNGVEVLNVDSSTASTVWTEYKITVPGTGAPAALAFQATGQENSLGAYIDNVSLFQIPTVHVDEDGLLAGNHDSAPGDDVVPNEVVGFDNNEATNYGVLGIKWGSDSYDDAVDQVVAVPGSATAAAYLTARQDAPSGLGDRSVTFTSNSVLVGGVPSLTSQGQAVTFVVEDDGTKIVGYASFGGNTQRAVIEVALSDEDSGYFRVALLDKIDHPVNGTEDNVTLSFGYTATDADGDTVKGSFAVSVDDDLPVTQAAAQNIIVNGDFTDGNWSDPQWWGSIGAADGVPGWSIIGDPSDPPHNGIQFERQSDGFEGLSSSTHNGMIDLGASPGNYQLSQVVSAAVDQQTYAIEFEIGAPFPGTALLQVYWGGQLIAIIDTTKEEGALDKYSYIVKGGPNDAANTLTFREVGEGHAPLPGEDQDEGYHGTYVANVKMFAVDVVVDEDGLNNANAVGVGNSDSIGDDPATAASAAGLLGIKWGADDHDTNDVGVQDAIVAGNRSVTFAQPNIVVGGAASLTSGGHDVATALVDNGTRLVGFVDTGVAGYDVGDHLVFDVKLSDDQTGSFLFTLYDKLDHAPGGNENDLTLRFGYTATDSDGDRANGFFIVGVDDDSPKAIADTDSVTGGSATGNVVTAVYTAAGTLGAVDGNSANGTADNPGTDGFKSIAWVGADNTGVIHGTYGDLHVDALGNYRYVLGHSSVAVPSLVVAQPTDVFTYAVTDGDGDVSNPATLTIMVNDTNVSPAVTDPIVLDLDGDGVHLNGAASFDLDLDGKPDSIAWPGAHDGLLVVDLDHSGAIEDGKEVFSPSFGEGGHKDSLGALATYDSNVDGKITADDAKFGDIGVWTDSNGNGVSDQSELHSLGDLGIVGIDLGTEEVDFDIDGQHAFAQGTFELANGDTHQFLGVELGPQSGDISVPAGITGVVQTGTSGADNFALHDVHAVDFIADYNFAQGDSVDLSALLGHNSGANASNAADYVHYDSGSGTLSVDTDGAAGGHNYVDVAVIDQPVVDVKIILDDGVDVTVNHLG